MNLLPEVKAQLEEQKKQCVFCKLVSGEMPAKTVFEDDKTIAMLDIYPAMKGHTIFMLKEHYPIMPYIPADEFHHFFGLIPQLTKAVKDAMIEVSINVFIANGGVAGQQSPHFLIHLFPRAKDDGFFNFFFKLNVSLPKEKKRILADNFPIMMVNHFKRNPAAWHQGAGERPAHLQKIADENTVIYGDEKVLVIVPKKGVMEGHIEIYSKEEEKDISKLSAESSAHLFYVASFAAATVFEGLGAQGTNIILKSGYGDDNAEGRLCLHILPRTQGDSLQSLHWQSNRPSCDLDSIVSQIRNRTWNIKYVKEKSEKVAVPSVKEEKKEISVIEIKKTYSNVEDEIREAIERIK